MLWRNAIRRVFQIISRIIFKTNGDFYRYTYVLAQWENQVSDSQSSPWASLVVANVSLGLGLTETRVYIM